MNVNLLLCKVLNLKISMLMVRSRWVSSLLTGWILQCRMNLLTDCRKM